jgi:hypothetical protein
MAPGSRARSLVGAALIAVGLLVACRQLTLREAYSRSGAYRAQVDALLDGRLALTPSPDGVAHDLVWTPGGVQQVWGLGVPLWQLPFEAVGRAVGWSPVPDRIALAAWLALAVLVVLRGFRPRNFGEPRPDDQRSDAGRTHALDSRALQLGALALTAVLPPLVTLMRGRIGVYEEAAIYSHGAAMILLGGLVALRRAPTTARYLVLVAFAGVTGLFRPTVWFYGLATLVAASAIIVRGRGRPALPAIAIGAALFIAGGGALYATNALRFGRGSEFGHRLNIEDLPGNLVATRFSYPFERVSTIEAAEELVGSLFDGPERRARHNAFYQKQLHRGQSAQPRWREYYFTAFSWPYAPAIAAGLVLAALAWRRRGDPVARTLGAWAVIGGGPLVVFYLHSPSMSSRYQLDLAPAIAALLVIAWRACAIRWPRRGLAVLAALWIAAVATSRTTRPPRASDPIDRDAAARAADAISRPTRYDRALPPAYDLADPYLPLWIDPAGDFARCRDALGAPLDCDAPALPGDAAILGHRIDRRWWVERYTVADEPPASVCRLDDDRADPPRCAGPTAVTSDPAAERDLGFVAPPALYDNAIGWDLATGSVPPATLFYVEDPAYLALDVTGPPGTDWARAVRVAVGLEHLRLVAAADTADGARLRFEGRLPAGLAVAFVAFGPDTELDHARSAFGLRSIRWRDQ